MGIKCVVYKSRRDSRATDEILERVIEQDLVDLLMLKKHCNHIFWVFLFLTLLIFFFIEFYVF